MEDKGMDMRLRRDVRQLRLFLEEQAEHGGEELARYRLSRPPMPPGLYWRARWLVALILRLLESVNLKRVDPWPAGLKQIAGSARARALLIWAVGVDRETLRGAYSDLTLLATSLPGFAPVLVTDVADFTNFSRLNCLVEYLPELTGEGRRYEERKVRLLARLYRSAPAVPLTALLECRDRPSEIRQWVLAGADIRETF